MTLDLYIAVFMTTLQLICMFLDEEIQNKRARL